MRTKTQWRLTALGLTVALTAVGCRTTPGPKWHASPYPQACTLVVVPFRNISGAPGLDPLVVTDEFVTELNLVEGMKAIPVNQVLAKMSELRMSDVASPQDALVLSDALGADGAIAGSVHRWDPYDPPVLAMTVLLYMRDDLQAARHDESFHVNPADLSRAGTSLDLQAARPVKAQNELTRVFDAGDERVVERMKTYVHRKHVDASPMGWRKIKTQRPFLRFVSYEVIGELLEQENRRVGSGISKPN